MAPVPWHYLLLFCHNKLLKLIDFCPSGSVKPTHTSVRRRYLVEIQTQKFQQINPNKWFHAKSKVETNTILFLTLSFYLFPTFCENWMVFLGLSRKPGGRGKCALNSVRTWSI